MIRRRLFWIPIMLVAALPAATLAQRPAAFRERQAATFPSGTSDDDKLSFRRQSSGQTVSARIPPNPEFVRLYLDDGSIMSGRLSPSAIVVETEFGVLTVPVTRLRSFTPGLDNCPELLAHVRQLVDELGRAVKAERDEAKQELLAMGPPVRQELRAYDGDANPERRRSIKSVLDALEAVAKQVDSDPTADPLGSEQWIRDDKVETTEFTIVGRIQQPMFHLKTKYGTLRITLGNIRTARRLSHDAALKSQRLQLVKQDTAIEARASANGKYKRLLRKIDVPNDRLNYGEFSDYGWYTGSAYAGHYGLPPGYWVYLFPRWYIWGEQQGQ